MTTTGSWTARIQPSSTRTSAVTRTATRCDDCAWARTTSAPKATACPTTTVRTRTRTASATPGTRTTTTTGSWTIPDVSPLDPDVCGDSDGDGCDDCAMGTDDFGTQSDSLPGNDGTDTDSDGECDAGDADDDNDGVLDGPDPPPTGSGRVWRLRQRHLRRLHRSARTNFGPLSDNLTRVTTARTRTVRRSLCDAGDTDDDNDGVILDGPDPSGARSRRLRRRRRRHLRRLCCRHG